MHSLYIDLVHRAERLADIAGLFDLEIWEEDSLTIYTTAQRGRTQEETTSKVWEAYVRDAWHRG